MATLNKVLLIGNVGADPEVKPTNAGQVARFSVAVNESWTDKSGQRQERTEWVRVVCFGSQAAFVARNIRRGATVFIEGRLETRSWEDATGSKRYMTEVIALQIQPVGSRDRRQDDEPTNPDAWTPRDAYDTPASDKEAQETATEIFGSNAASDDDVPF